MISLKKYLEATDTSAETDLLTAAMAGYTAALMAIGRCSIDACPGLGDALNKHLSALVRTLSAQMSGTEFSASDAEVRKNLEQWGHDAARHYQAKSEEVKQLILAMLQTAEGVGTRDLQCAGQIQEVTERLKAVASLDDLSEIRASIVSSAVLLKSSIDRMTEEGKAAVDRLRGQINTYQAKLDEAEKLAMHDALTGVRSRLSLENQIERAIVAGDRFSVAVIDIDGFKKVNDQYGHLAGDELLKQFAGELASASRSTDTVGRWGGDEFLLLLNSTLDEASTQAERLEKWVCGNYTLQLPSGPVSLDIHASIGLAESVPGESIKKLLERADHAMYSKKANAAR
jgi:diguanylate cyclase (GGDEF)-like protein